MKKRFITFLIDAFITKLFLILVIVSIGLLNGAALHYGDEPEVLNWDREGPYIFFENDSLLTSSYIRGNMEDGYFIERSAYPADSSFSTTSFNPMDGTSFDFIINAGFSSPATSYNDRNKIMAISDIEGNYQTFRDFLIKNNVIDQNLKWSFGQGHLVLLGDFVDRGFFSTQVLWLIYKLEQEAKNVGGQVHYILGNHEIKNLQGNYMSAAPKYFHVASILGRQQYQLYDEQSLLGRWMATKNTAELINGHLFVHGGIHPNIADSTLTLNRLNRMVRDRYRKAYYPKPGDDLVELFVSTETGPSWYRGYFKDDDLTEKEVDKGLLAFGANKVVVGHTLISDVKSSFNGKVIGINVGHPSDDHKNWPEKRSEGLLIDGDSLFRVLDTGEKIEMK